MAVFTKNRLAHAISASLPLALGLSLSGCGDDNLNPDDIGAPDTYNFSSQTSRSGESSVDYRDAITRLVLIKELEYLIGSKFLQDYATGKTKEQVVALLNGVYASGTAFLATNNIYDLYDPKNVEDAGPTPIKSIALTDGLELQQTHFSDLSPNINLRNIMPGTAYDLHFIDGNDKLTLIGWGLADVQDKNDMPEAMIQQWFGVIASLAIDGDSETRYMHRASGRNYQQLISSFLMGAISFGRSMNTHLNHGLNASNTSQDPSAPYTSLQNHWDMAFGYYGAARQLIQLTKEQSISQPAHNYEGSDIDIFSEYIFTYPVDAANRDLGSALYDTNYFGQPMQAFLNGRQLIDTYYPDDGINNPEFKSDLDFQANIILQAWEKTLVSTAVHFINRAAQSSGYYGPNTTYNDLYFTDWSMAKGYLLALQFNPHTELKYEDYKELNNLLKNGPELGDSRDRYKYARDLLSTHSIFEATYSIPLSNLQEW